MPSLKGTCGDLETIIKGIIICLFCFSGILSTTTFGATITAVANGPWSTNATWSCNCQPTNADNVIIPVGKTVSITAGPVILTGGPIITITISGTLSLNSGGTLIVDSNDIVKVNTGGKITATGILCAVWSGGTPIFVAGGSSINGPSTITSGSLPITLLFFTGEVKGNEVLLVWASASEKNFDYYSIEHSGDGENFEPIAKVKGAGNSTQRLNYSFTDTKPVSGISYYRLRSVDFDGSDEIFSMIRIEIQSAVGELQLYPNPITNNQLTARLNFLPKAESEISIYSILGNLVYAQPFGSASSECKIEIPVSLGKGIYFLTVKTDSGNFKSTIFVQ